MTISQIENNIQELLKNIQKETFIFDLLLAYGTPKSSIRRLQIGQRNLATEEGTILWKDKLFFKEVSLDNIDLESFLKDEKIKKQKPRFFILTDFNEIQAYDTKTKEILNSPIRDLHKDFDFFLPWAGIEKAQHQNENPADVKAAERMAQLYDDIRKDNPEYAEKDTHALNVFLSRLLFCLFAEDTGIFEEGIFTNTLDTYTHKDGSDVADFLNTLFQVLNTAESERGDVSNYLQAFPYVNGGLFKEFLEAPKFTRKSRQTIIDAGELDWSAINPDIFGSMIQAVITPEHRGGLGMHYTSVPNIMKVIKPLFLDELHEIFKEAAAMGNVASKKKRLNELLERIWRIKIFDPACGSGNFLIIAYKELRILEINIYRELDELDGKLNTGRLDFGADYFSKISLNQFYGIELDGFAHEIAILSLWLAEHQMNQLFLKVLGRTKPALPLQDAGHIVQGNACRIDWEIVCPKLEGDEIYILGNPPYLGARNQSIEQKEDMKIIFEGKVEGYNNLDYIAAWFAKAADFVKNWNAKYALVSTNSISQGAQVSLLWPYIFKNNLEIYFAYQSFKWENNAKAQAAVIVVIIGIRNRMSNPKLIYKGDHKILANNISPYLVKGKDLYVSSRNNPLSKIPEMNFGSMPNDGGHLLLTEEEYKEILTNNPNIKKYIKRFVGSKDFINNISRWCIWVEDQDLEDALTINFISNRISKVVEHRNNSSRQATRNLASTAHKFAEIRFKNTDSIIIPRVSSERREYVPIGFLSSDYIISDGALSIYNAKPWYLGIITSKMHMAWLSAIGGRLKTDYRYSATLVYNTFPFPAISEAQKKELENHAFQVLEARERHSEKTLAQLYNPEEMPDDLRKAHHDLDMAVERCYRKEPFESDEERLEYLFKLYEQMIEKERK